MLPLNLSANEARIIGCLMEKSITTPDGYPLTLNALTNACNQKSSREPVMSLAQGVVQHDARLLEGKHLLRIEDGFKRGVEKYAQRFCNTSFCELQFDAAQFAIVCLLLLRGPQTPGELRARSGRLHEFADNNAVVEALTGLIEREGNALAVQLPRTPGRKEAEYMHLFSGPVDMQALAEKAQSDSDSGSSARVSMAELAQRVTDLEAEVAELRKLLE
ncbi:MAG: YceH family protein [Gammaproteobacteria bacterium]